MNHKKGLLYLFALIVLFSTIIIPEESDAQMRIPYPNRFRFTGLIELKYINYSTETTYNVRRLKSSFNEFDQLYRLGVEGYIYHPRLAVFSSSITFSNVVTKNTEARNIGYDLSTTFLPYRPVSLLLYAVRENSTVRSTYGTSTDITQNVYGARLSVNYVKRRLPLFIAEYQHQDLSSDFTHGKTATDTYSLEMRGFLRFISTRYMFNYSFSDYSSPTRKFNTQYISGYTDTGIKGNSFQTDFKYYDREDSKTWSFTARLLFKPQMRFNHSYYYSYYHSEYQFQEEKIESDDSIISGTWSYKFTDRLNGAVSLEYGKHKFEQLSSTSRGISASLNYGRPIFGLNLTSRYRLLFRKDERRGESIEHDFGLGLMTKKLKWARIYADYNFRSLHRKIIENPRAEEFEEFVESKSETTIHLFRIGASGRLQRRINWTLQGEYLKSDSKRERPVLEDWEEFGEFEEEVSPTIEHKLRHYSLVGYLTYITKGRGTLYLKGGYTTGETDSRKIRRYYYEGRYNYTVSRRLSLLAWLRGIHNKLEGSVDSTIREGQLEANYRKGRVLLTLEVYVARIEEITTTTIRKISLRFRRYF